MRGDDLAGVRCYVMLDAREFADDAIITIVQSSSLLQPLPSHFQARLKVLYGFHG